MHPSLAEVVRKRAKRVCEYCRLPEAEFQLRHVVDHIRARKHRGGDELGNLALACLTCNLHKGSNIYGVDPQTDQSCRLFNPRADRWRDHFRWDGVRIEGTTPEGRTTVEVLAMNQPGQIAARLALLRSGWLLQIDL